MSRKTNPLTPDIIIQTLKRSSLNTILIEGKDDKIIFDLIEKEINNPLISFMPCGGRNTLIEIYNQKDNIGTKCLFFCDSDMWIFENFQNIEDNCLIKTKGYSIENDLFLEGKEKVFELFDKQECERFKQIIDVIKDWFAYQVHLYLNKKSFNYDKNICSDKFFSKCKVLDDEYSKYNKSLIERNIVDKLKNDTYVYLRGKFIFQAAQKIFSERTNKPKVTYKNDQLFDLMARHIINKENSFLAKNIKHIKTFFDLRN